MKYIKLSLKITLFTIVSISILYQVLTIETNTHTKAQDDNKLAKSIFNMASQANIKTLTK